MAIMYPSNIESVLYTESEKLIYNELKRQLSNEYHVFFSISWFEKKDGIKAHSECDFLIFNPQFGYITLEVKGGKGLEVENGTWKLLYNENEYRILKRSPFRQAEESMYFFSDYFKKEFGYGFNGIFGCAVAFPFFSIKEDLVCDGPKDLIIDIDDMYSLQKKVNEIFHYWRGRNSNFVFFSQEQKAKFISIINKRIAISAAAGALIKAKDRQLQEINRMQENYIQFITNYRQAFIKGSAGTGKTWIAVKKARQLSNLGRDVLLLCYNNKLCEFIKMELSMDKIDVETFHSLSKKLLDYKYSDLATNNLELKGIFDFISQEEGTYKRYDAILIDEAQDFSQEWAMLVRLLLKSEKSSLLYAFYDMDQNIFSRNFENEFMIDFPEFILVENLRNTSNIFNWAVKRTGLGTDSLPNIIEGAEPETAKFNSDKKARIHLNNLLNMLVKNECVDTQSIVILSDRKKENSILDKSEYLGSFKIVEDINTTDVESVRFATVQSFKGLEADVVIFLDHTPDSPRNMQLKYVAYTRAKYFLYVIEIEV